MPDTSADTQQPKKPKEPLTHIECLPGEIYKGNKVQSLFDAMPHQAKRKGIKCFKLNGDEMIFAGTSGQRIWPVFVSEQEDREIEAAKAAAAAEAAPMPVEAVDDHPEREETERCTGNWTLDEFERMISDSKRRGNIPYDHQGFPHANVPGHFPVFVHEHEGPISFAP